MNEMLETIAAGPYRCGEAPIWDGVRQRLIWTDIEGGTVQQWTPASERVETISRGLTVSGIALNRAGEFVFAGPTGLHLWRSQDQCRVIASEHDGEALVFNDIIADPRGRIYAGTLHWGANGMEKRGKLYLIATDLPASAGSKIRVADDGIELANGLGFSPDNKTLYFADSAARVIYAYDWHESGELTRKRIFVRVSADDGIPDGLTVDADGCVWCAMWYGAQVIRYRPDGSVERRLRLPVRQVSSVAFGGRDLDELFVTTAADPWRSALAPPGYDFSRPNHGGAVYRARVEAPGKPEHLANFRALDSTGLRAET